MRAEMEARAGIDAIDIYGLSEVMGPGVAQECVETKDGLHVWEDHFYPEVIDPVTGEVLPDGEPGELVFTSLTKQAMPVIRYRTRDLTRLLPGTARTMRRMEKITGRTDDMIILRGVNLFPTQVEELILRVPALSPHFQLHLTRRGRMDAMTVHVERRPDADPAAAEAAAAQLTTLIKNTIGVTAATVVQDPDTIERSMGKMRRIIDERPEPAAGLAPYLVIGDVALDCRLPPGKTPIGAGDRLVVPEAPRAVGQARRNPKQSMHFRNLRIPFRACLSFWSGASAGGGASRWSRHLEAGAFRGHDRVPQFGLGAGVYRVRRRVRHVAAARVLVERLALGGQQLEDPLVDAVLAQQPVHVDRADLAHPVRAGDRLLLDRRGQLRLGDDDHGRGLDVQAHAARLDLGDQHRRAARVRQLVHHRLALGRRDVPGQRSDRPACRGRRPARPAPRSPSRARRGSRRTR